MSSADVVVVGGGIEGLSVAWALAERGAGDVLVLERDTLCAGGTGKSSGVVRCHYGVRSLAAMAWHGVSVFERAEEVLGQDIGFTPTGYVVGVGPPDVAALAANVAMHRSLGIDARLASADEVQAWWPQADLEDFAAFAYEPRGGHGDAYRTGRAYAHAAVRLGARLRQHARVTAVTTDPSGRRVTGVVVDGGEEIRAGSVVVAAGPWSVALCAPLGVDLPIRAQREQILIVDPGEPISGAPVFSDLVDLQYVRTEPSGELLVGNSDHSAPQFTDPDRYPDRADDEYVTQAVGKLDRRFPKLRDPRLRTGYAGCYDVTPDYNPIISESPVDGLYLCAGFSGHGFKISAAVGRLMADVMTSGASSAPDIDAADFRHDRFERGLPLLSPHPYRGAGQMR